MKYYRDLTAGETLQAGDEAFRGGNDWASVVAELYGLTPSDVPWKLFRRPVDAVPREEHERLQKELTDTVDKLRAEIQSLNIQGLATSHDWEPFDLTNKQKAPVTKPPSAEPI